MYEIVGESCRIKAKTVSDLNRYNKQASGAKSGSKYLLLTKMASSTQASFNDLAQDKR